ncbi:MAG: PP2C family protein-serine/threonine phosphatase [Planctomycetota bacterium]|nr:serine/threonine-protein phosphatase [Planctomycetota bacterium]MDW8372626.1 PP2C family protein-serine/threonine phosphatase [Planctomycetota bacterium]
MPWFSRKQEPSPEELAARAEAERKAAADAELKRRIALALEKDPAHRVTTVDGLHWICPYTLKLIPAAFGFQEAAAEYLFRERPFAGGVKPKSLHELLTERWRLHLSGAGEFEPRLRLFGPDGRWLNPYTGQWQRLPLRTGVTPAEATDAIAAALAECREANAGGELLPLERLREIEAKALREHKEAPDEAKVVGVTRRISGRRTEELGKLAGGDLERAKGILDKMLAEMPDIPGFGLAVHYEPQEQIGGDFFACLPLGDDRYYLAVADVAGHGVQGALIVVAALKALRFIIGETSDLVQIACRLNESVKADLLHGQFITCWMGILEAGPRRLTHLCCGHTPLAIANPRSEPLVRRIAGGKAPALGMMAPALFNRAVRPIVTELQPGDLAMQYTDGLTESKNAAQEEFGDLRAIGALVGVCDRAYDDAVDRIAADARRFALGSFQDDVTILLLQCDPPRPDSGEPGETRAI